MGKTTIEGLIGAGSVFATHLFQRKQGKGLARFGVMTHRAGSKGRLGSEDIAIFSCSVPEYQGEFDNEDRAGAPWPK